MTAATDSEMYSAIKATYPYDMNDYYWAQLTHTHDPFEL